MTSIQIELPTSHRDRFDSKIREMRAGQVKNVTMFSDREYNEFVTKLKEFKNPGYRMTPYEFSLLKRFEILRVEKDGEIIERLVKPNTRLRFMTYEGLFDAIKGVHEDNMKHGCRDILNKKLF